MALRRPDPSFMLVTAFVACLVAVLTLILSELALSAGVFEPRYPDLHVSACRSDRLPSAPNCD